MSPILESISLDALATITGGCGKKKCAPCCPQPQPEPAAPAPQPVASAPEVSTRVSVNYGQ
jgi:hypothetical protein